MQISRLIYVKISLFLRFFIVRLFKPPGLQLAKLRCKIKFGDTEFLSRYLEPPKAEKVILK